MMAYQAPDWPKHSAMRHNWSRFLRTGLRYFFSLTGSACLQLSLGFICSRFSCYFDSWTCHADVGGTPLATLHTWSRFLKTGLKYILRLRRWCSHLFSRSAIKHSINFFIIIVNRLKEHKARLLRIEATGFVSSGQAWRTFWRPFLSSCCLLSS